MRQGARALCGASTGKEGSGKREDPHDSHDKGALKERGDCGACRNFLRHRCSVYGRAREGGEGGAGGKNREKCGVWSARIACCILHKRLRRAVRCLSLAFVGVLKKGLGFTVRKKELKRITVTTKEGEAIEEKGNMDVEMTIDAIHHMKKYTTAVLFSGDSDFLALVTYLRREGKKVYIFSSKNNVSQELRTGGDGYFDVLDITEDIWGKELQHRAEKKH